MATYIALLNWTDQGIKTYQETIDRTRQASEHAKSMNVNLKEVYWTLGQYDMVGILEAPDDESATAFALSIGSQGNVRTTSLRAFSRDEMGGILQRATGG